MTDFDMKRKEELAKDFEEKTKEEYVELAIFAINILRRAPKEEREEFMEEKLTKTKRFLMKFIEEKNI